LYLFQNHLIYQPQRYCSDELKTESKPLGLTLWPSSESYRGLLAEPLGEITGTAVVAHGNAGSALDRVYYVEPLLAFGYRVILLEYPGYGCREGKPAEADIVSDVRESIRLVREHYQTPILLIGESLGSGVAAESVVGLEDQIQGVILFTPWDDLPSVAQSVYWFLPARYLAREHYNSVQNLKDYANPIALIVAELDELIPRKCSQRLFDSLQGEKRLWVIGGASHNTWPEAVDSAWWREVVNYVTGKKSKG
jgi:hypothetical protein